MRRPGLLLAAAATVTVPGVLAVLAVLGHDHGAAALADADGMDSASVTGQSAPGGWTAGPSAVPSAGTSSNRRPGAGTPARVPGARQLGASLLGKAATASLAASYQGTEVISQTGVTGVVTEVSQVWHWGGGATVMRTSAGGRVVSFDDAGQAPAGVFGLTSTLVKQLDKHYIPAYAGAGGAVGRPAAVINLYRLDGSLAARYWLDRRTMVPLQRELFDATAKVIGEDKFTRVRFGAPAARSTSSTASPASGAASAYSWSAAASPARFLASLASESWRLPATLPGGLPLYAAAWTTSADSRVVDLEYSDGLYVVSLFVQRGTLGTGMTGWRQLSLGGQRVYVSGRSLAWAGAGLVYTMITDTPPATAAQDVAAVQASSPSTGLLGRLGKGLDRLARLLNPFG
jgi:sigma-E factor negative regulatory protein RseB